MNVPADAAVRLASLKELNRNQRGSCYGSDEVDTTQRS